MANLVETTLIGEDFKNFITGLNTFVYEGVWRFNEYGLTCNVVDPANVALIIASLPANVFDAYLIEEDTKLGVDVRKLTEISKLMGKNTNVDITTDGSQLKLRFDNITYTSTLLEPSTVRKDPKIPNLDFKAGLTVDPKKFGKAVKACGKVSEQLNLKTDENGFFIMADGDADSLSFKFDYSGKETARSHFTYEYLGAFKPFGDALLVKLGDDIPGSFKFVSDESDGLSIEYLIAPRIVE